MPGLVLALLFSLLVPQEASTRAPEGKTQYEVRYKWGLVDTRVANCVLSVTQGEYNGQPALHSEVSIRATPFFRLFMAEEYWMELFLSADGSLPLYSYAPMKVKGKECEFYVLYNQENRQLERRTLSATEDLQDVFSLNEGSMDLFALFYYLMGMDVSGLEAGRPVSLQVIMPRSVAPLQVYYVGEDAETIPGEVSQHFRLQFTGRGVMENKSGKSAQVWLSSGPERKLLMLSIPLNNGVMVARIKRA